MDRKSGTQNEKLKMDKKYNLRTFQAGALAKKIRTWFQKEYMKKEDAS